jgi:DNA-binding XRE family transcriptional regulator
MDVTQKPGTHPNRVRELREDRLMTQAQLARKARVALRTIHSVEKGMNCRMDTKRKILLALGMRFEDKDQVFPSGRRAGGYSSGLEALTSLSAGPLPGSEDNLG